MVVACVWGYSFTTGMADGTGTAALCIPHYNNDIVIECRVSDSKRQAISSSQRGKLGVLVEWGMKQANTGLGKVEH